MAQFLLLPCSTAPSSFPSSAPPRLLVPPPAGTCSPTEQTLASLHHPKALETAGGTGSFSPSPKNNVLDKPISLFSIACWFWKEPKPPAALSAQPPLPHPCISRNCSSLGSQGLALTRWFVLARHLNSCGSGTTLCFAG